VRLASRGGQVAATLAVLAVVASGGCTRTRVVATPEFARQPFAPFSRTAAVEIALREWRLFGERYDDRSQCPPEHGPKIDPPERRDGLWQRVAEYRWLGLDADHPRRAGTGKHDARGRIYAAESDESYAWSAAFVSYVMRIAGAGDRFPYDDAHATYINDAARAARGEAPVRALVAQRPEAYAPVLGDLVCTGRERAEALGFDDLPAGKFPSHCGIVVGLLPDALLVIGGNVADAVTMTRVPTTADHRLVGPDGIVVDVCTPWFVVLAVQYDA
jgi:hypothetical protein